jgi:hypothetical protein
MSTESIRSLGYEEDFQQFGSFYAIVFTLGVIMVLVRDSKTMVNLAERGDLILHGGQTYFDPPAPASVH